MKNRFHLPSGKTTSVCFSCTEILPDLDVVLFVLRHSSMMENTF